MLPFRFLLISITHTIESLLKCDLLFARISSETGHDRTFQLVFRIHTETNLRNQNQIRFISYSISFMLDRKKRMHFYIYKELSVANEAFFYNVHLFYLFIYFQFHQECYETVLVVIFECEYMQIRISV